MESKLQDHEAVCAECGKTFWMPYPNIWGYRDGNKRFCSWSCLRQEERRNEMERMKKDGTPAKRPGRKPVVKVDGGIVLEETPGSCVQVVPVGEPVRVRTKVLEGTAGIWEILEDGVRFESHDHDEIAMSIEMWNALIAETPVALEIFRREA